MRWHTQECMEYAARTQRPWCIIECADKWRELEAWIHETINEPIFNVPYRMGVHAAASKLGIYEEFPEDEEVNSNAAG